MSMRISAAASSMPLATQLSRAPSVARTPQSAASPSKQIPSSQAVRKPTEIGQIHEIANSLRQQLKTEGSALKTRVEGQGGKLEVGNDAALSKSRLNIGKADFKSPAAAEAMMELQELVKSKVTGEGKTGDPQSLAGMIEELQQKMIEQHGATGHLLNMVV